MNTILRSGAMLSLTLSGLLFATAANAQSLEGQRERYCAPMGVPIVVAAPGVLENELNAGGYTSKQDLTAVLDHEPRFGTVVLASDGGFVYTPLGKTTGDSFTYICTDTFGNAATSEAVMIYEDVIANADEYEVAAEMTNFVSAPGVLANDAGPAGGIIAALVTTTQFGELDLHPDGSFTYVPDVDMGATADEFTYAAVDVAGNSSTATVRLLFIPADQRVLSISGGTPGSDAGGDVGSEGGSCSAREGISPWLLLACLALLVPALKMRRAGA